MEDRKKLHIVMFPWLAYGHIMPFLEVSKYLAQKGHQISFVSTPKNIQRLPKLPSNLAPLVSLVDLPLPHIHGLPETAESTADLPIHKVPYLKKAYDLLQQPLTHFIKRVANVDWIVHDFVSHWVPPVATQLGIPSVYFSIFNATTLAFLGSPSGLIDGNRRLPEDFTVVPEWIPYPSNVAFRLHEMVRHQECMDSDASDFYRFGKVIQGCRFVTLRSCPEFEPNSLSLLQKLYGKPVVPVGLLPPSVQQHGVAEPEGDKSWEVLKEWLDQKSVNSVVYVALGTEVTPSQEEMHELAYGIERSGLPFVWVVKNHPLLDGSKAVPPGFETRVSGRGLVWTGWVPQLRILGHSSVGGFLTHCGWSSSIEALGYGRVLILFPGSSSDLGLVARLLHGKKVGLEIPRDERDGSFTSDCVAESIRRVMVDEEGEPLRANAWAMREIFGNADLHVKCLDEFTRFLETVQFQLGHCNPPS